MIYNNESKHDPTLFTNEKQSDVHEQIIKYTYCIHFKIRKNSYFLYSFKLFL